MSDESNGDPVDEDQLDPVEWSTFLEDTPPHQRRVVEDISKAKGSRGARAVRRPTLRLHCDTEECGGFRRFTSQDQDEPILKEPRNYLLHYRCRNCQRSAKVFAFVGCITGDYGGEGVALKFGEAPPFGPPVPSSVIELIGPDRDAFLKGRRVENQGFGIGAFAYYRRVVERQQGRLLRKIRDVAERVDASDEVLDKIDRAADEQQFKKAVEIVDEGMPSELLVDGHNPLVLLHRALSVGIHQGTDADCLEMAKTIRLVLTDLSERLSQALRNQAELKEAVGRLTRAHEEIEGDPSL